MKLLRIIKGLAIWGAVWGFCLPQPLLAASPASQSPVVIDVALCDGGALLGQMVDPQGVAKANVPVWLHASGRELAASQTDAMGYFVFSGLRGGTYQVTAANGVAAYRLWAPGTAPPSAQQGILIVAGQDVARGRLGGIMGPIGFVTSRPLFVMAMFAGAGVGTWAIVEAATEGGPFTVP